MKTRVNKNEEGRIWINILFLSFIFFHILKRVLLKWNCLFDCCRDVVCQTYFYNTRGLVTSVLILLVLKNYYKVNLLDLRFIFAFIVGVIGYRYFQPYMLGSIANVNIFNQIVLPLFIILIVVGLHSWIHRDQ